MKKLKQLSRNEMKHVKGSKRNPNDGTIGIGDGGGMECGCVAAFCVSNTNSDGSKYCSASTCC